MNPSEVKRDSMEPREGDTVEKTYLIVEGVWEDRKVSKVTGEVEEEDGGNGKGV